MEYWRNGFDPEMFHLVLNCSSEWNLYRHQLFPFHPDPEVRKNIFRTSLWHSSNCPLLQQCNKSEFRRWRLLVEVPQPQGSPNIWPRTSSLRYISSVIIAEYRVVVRQSIDRSTNQSTNHTLMDVRHELVTFRYYIIMKGVHEVSVCRWECVTHRRLICWYTAGRGAGGYEKKRNRPFWDRRWLSGGKGFLTVRPRRED